MSAIVAIGGAHLIPIVEAYRRSVPCTVWTLGLPSARDARDPQRRALESLLTPVVEAYFPVEARARLAARPVEATLALPVAGEVVHALESGLADAMALVAQLDAAHAEAPVELVVTDGASAAALTAAAWGRARGIPAIALPVTRLEPRFDPAMGATLALGRWARRAAGPHAAAAGIELLPPAAPPPEGQSAARRAQAREAISRVGGWAPADVVVVFELDGPGDGEPTLEAVLLGFAAARAEVPGLRLTILGPPDAGASEGAERVQRGTAQAGLGPADVLFAARDHEVWMAGADIVVSTESSRSVEAALAGVAAINLWLPSTWMRGSAFGAEDGVVQVDPARLGATLTALGANAAVRAQIAAVAAARIGDDPPAGPQAAARVAEALVRRRLPASRARRTPLDIVVVAPDYRHDSAGVRALHRLCHLLNCCGARASLYPATQLHPGWNTPRRDVDLTDETIVVYPESTERLFTRGRGVRWVLNVPGLLGGPTRYGDDEMVFFWRGFGDAAQHATTQSLGPDRDLTLATIDPELYYEDRSRARLYDCIYVGKGEATYAKLKLPGLDDALVIRRGETPWPANRAQTAELLRGCRNLYTYDLHSAIGEEAVICGAAVYYVHPDGTLERDVHDPGDYASRYYDRSPVERFLAQLERRWPSS